MCRDHEEYRLGVRKCKYEIQFFPRAMWAVFQGSFKRQLPIITCCKTFALMRRSKHAYREILWPIPEFDRNDPFLVNLLTAAMLAAVYLNLPEKPDLESVTTYYHRSMTENAAMTVFLRMDDHYSAKAQARLARQAESNRYQNNPYTWQFRFEAGPDLYSYSAYFDTCGIQYLFRKLGISEIIPAMCSYDYDMAELGGSIFNRQHTLAGGGPCCDCHYQKKEGSAPK